MTKNNNQKSIHSALAMKSQHMNLLCNDRQRIETAKHKQRTQAAARQLNFIALHNQIHSLAV